MKFSVKLLLRLVLYVLGLIFLAFSVAFAVNSNLGISPVNSLPNAISLISGLSLGTMVTIVFCCYVVIQFLLQTFALHKKITLKSVLLLAAQMLVSTVFGYFTDFAKKTLGDFCIGGPALTIGSFSLGIGQLLMMFISIVLIAIGISLYVDVRLVAMPADSLTGVLAETFKIKFHNMKVIQDCVTVSVSAIIGFIAFRKLVGVGIGTVLSAFLVGKIIGFVQKFIKPFVCTVCGLEEK